MERFIVKLIEAYRLMISPFFRYSTSLILLPPVCKFYPTCSEYAVEAVKKYGPTGGLFRAVKRIMRCHPWASPGMDLP